MVQFQALGSLSVTEDGREIGVGGPRQRRLVAMLLIHRNTVVSVDRLVDAVFAGDPTPGAATTLRSYVARVRKVVGGQSAAPRILTQAPGYLLALTNGAFDVSRFEEATTSARSLLPTDAPGAIVLLREALALWRGEPYAEFADEDWARPESQRLSELRLVAYEALFEAELACGRSAEIVPELEGLAHEQPLRESFRAQLMIALYRCGRQADALAVYQDHRRTLVDELGLDPTPALADLERRILAHDASLLMEEPPGLPLRGYCLGERLGTGRAGTVYAARLQGVDRDVAIRVVHPELADRPEFVRSFDSRAARIAGLRHPAIVPILDHWREPGAAYLVLRRMHGGTLADHLTRGPLPASELGALIERIGGALLAAAEVGVNHGRVTADNVLFDRAGEPCLTDFDLIPGATAADDVAALVGLVPSCLAEVPEEVAAVLDRARATVGRPTTSELVPLLVETLTGVQPRSARPAPNPYKGLRAFDEVDSRDFFGRDRLVDELLARLAHDDQKGRLVLVVGGSGTGKSSVVRAGLLPRLRGGDLEGSQDWFITTILPGAAPFEALADGLRQVAVVDSAGLTAELAGSDGGIDRVIRRLLPDDGQMLLVVDQFEELFTSAPEADQRAFLDGLMAAITAPDSRLRVVATLRGDFYDRPLAFQSFGPAVNDATVTVPAMSPADLEAAVVEPAQRVGRGVELALVAELVNAVSHEPAALPALQFTLYELAENGNGDLRLAAYRELGEVDGAIAGRAEALYRSLDDAERTAVRRLFERLVVVTADGEPTRRRAPRAELVGSPPDPTVDVAVDHWAEARLLSLDRDPQSREPTVEPAHEALLREWPRLRGWIEHDRDALVVLGHLREAAAGWIALNRDSGALYRGARLQGALDVVDRRPDSLPEGEREFLEASRQARERAQHDAADAAARQARSNRRLRMQLGVIAIALVVALIGGLMAIDQRGEAEDERATATARELAAASTAALAEDPERSILLALASIDVTGDEADAVIPEAVEALHEAVASSRLLLSVPELGGTVAWSPAGDLFVTEGPEQSGVIDLRDARTGASVRRFAGHEIDVNDVAFSADGSLLATTGDDGALRVWDPANGHEVVSFDYPDSPVWGPSFSADGSTVAASWIDGGAVRVFDVASGRTRSEIPLYGGQNTSLRPDGEQIAISYGPAVVVEVDTGRLLMTVGEGVRDLAYSPDGRRIATVGGDGTARVWRADTGEELISLANHTGAVNGVAWSRDGRRLATVGDDGTARVTEVTGSGAREVVVVSAQGTGNGLYGVAFSPDGSRIVTGDWGLAAAKVWDVSPTGGPEWGNVQAFGPVHGGPTSLTFTPDGEGVVVSTRSDTVAVVDIEGGSPRSVVEAPSPTGVGLKRFAVTPDGEVVATARETGLVDLWDLASGELLTRIATDEGSFIIDLAWSPDGRRLAIAEGDDIGGWTVVVDRSGSELARLREEDSVYSPRVRFSPDGRQVASTRDPRRDEPELKGVLIWDWERSELLRTLDTPAIRAEYDPTSHRIVALGELEAIAEVWDSETGERLADIPRGDSLFHDIAFSPDGSRLATAGADGVVRLWDPATGDPVLALRGHDTSVHNVAFSPDGSRLASMGSDGVVRVWALELDDLVEIARDRITRGLTEDECRQYLHLEDCGDA